MFLALDPGIPVRVKTAVSHRFHKVNDIKESASDPSSRHSPAPVPPRKIFGLRKKISSFPCKNRLSPIILGIWPDKGAGGSRLVTAGRYALLPEAVPRGIFHARGSIC